MKKLIVLILSLVMVVTLIAACGNGGTGDDVGGGGDAATNGAAADDAAGEEAGTDETAAGDLEIYTIQILVGATEFSFSDLTTVGQYIRDRFGIVIELIPFTGDIRERQNLMLAGGDFGELQYMQRDDIVSSYISAGALLELDQFQDIMPDFWARFGEVQIPLWRLVGNGTLYKWETNVPRLGELDIEVNDIMIRTDVLEYFDWPNPVSASEWISFLKDAIEAFPEYNGQPTVAITVPFAEPWGIAGLSGIMYEKGDTYLPLGNEGFLFNYRTQQFVDYFQSEYVRESLRWFNQLYRYGLLDPEAFTDTFDRTQEKLNNGTALAVWYAGWVDSTVLPEYRHIITMPVQSDRQVAEGQVRLVRVEDTRNFDSWGITTNARYPERLAELVNWAASDEGQIILRNGIEGIHWVRNDEGLRELTELGAEARRSTQGEVNQNEGLTVFAGPLSSFNMLAPDGQFHDLFAHAAIQERYGATERQRYAWAQLGWENSRSWYIENMHFGHTGIAGGIYIETASELGRVHQQMADLRIRWSARLIMADSDEDFDDLWAQAMEEYDRLDHEAVIAEFNRLLAEAKAELGQ